MPILKEINPEYSLEGLMLKLKLWLTLATWCKEPTLWKIPWWWERLKARGEGDDRGWDGWMASLTQWTWVWANSGRWWRTGKPGMVKDREAWHAAVHGVAKSQMWLSDWTTTFHRWNVICLRNWEWPCKEHTPKREYKASQKGRGPQILGD